MGSPLPLLPFAFLWQKQYALCQEQESRLVLRYDILRGWRIRYGSPNTTWDYLQYLQSRVFHGAYASCFYWSPADNLGAEAEPGRSHLLPESVLKRWRTMQNRRSPWGKKIKVFPESTCAMVQIQTSCYITGQAGTLAKQAWAKGWNSAHEQFGVSGELKPFTSSGQMTLTLPSREKPEIKFQLVIHF